MPISAEEAERRRGHVRVAPADSRIEGYPPPSDTEQEVWEAYIQGDIEAADLVTAIKAAIGLNAE
jgi:hypothetical protein